MKVDLNSQTATIRKLNPHLYAPPVEERPLSGAEAREERLHEKIMVWCDQQWPRWKYVHSRMDRKTTTETGVADFVVFAPGGRVIVVECKARGRKLSKEQRDWSHEMFRLDHTVHLVYSLDEWVQITVVAQTP